MKIVSRGQRLKAPSLEIIKDSLAWQMRNGNDVSSSPVKALDGMTHVAFPGLSPSQTAISLC